MIRSLIKIPIAATVLIRQLAEFRSKQKMSPEHQIARRNALTRSRRLDRAAHLAMKVKIPCTLPSITSIPLPMIHLQSRGHRLPTTEINARHPGSLYHRSTKLWGTLEPACLLLLRLKFTHVPTQRHHHNTPPNKYSLLLTQVVASMRRNHPLQAT